ncbi:amino acid ABC transporter permease [Ligilactobacillus ruminis]|uniref:Polar amino acid ABC transporter permease n=3 Tax=Ligilactobacillus ruminis TaxID=1623 RepID=G2SPW2_LIGR2|nr:amino acid ABC transporter permease [Ligilactobacillus ruminis]AEN78564.1 polar amino acid ABC transporter permease [Ligilactobacillus ruminis ATCC 27782]KLA47214.1 polar amino acid ABC transporter permease [Ligilactobacillus ruminis]SFG26594.1 polar amino acid transport system permease protein [Ligilactobacillus ruminis DSM 20403 = NBRC 102161]
MNYIFEIMPSLLDGTEMTLSIFVLTLVFSLPLGLICALGRCSKFKILNAVLRFYIWLMRGTPLLLQLIFVFYGLPLLGTGIVLPRYAAALVAFVLNYTAYFAEIFRGGLQSIDRGQYESAGVLRLTYWQTIRKIIAPQVMKIVVPSIGNEVINLIKDSSLVYVIGLGDLLRAGNVASSRDVSLIPLVLVGIIYLALTAVFTWMLQNVEAVYGKWK